MTAVPPRSVGPQMRILAAAPVGNIVAELGEGPRWDPDSQALVWLDVPRLLMHRMDLHGEVHTTTLSRRVSAIGFCMSRRRYVAATDCGFGFVDPKTGCVASIVEVEQAAQARMNDGGVDGAGRFFAGSVSSDADRSNGSLHCLRPDGTVRRVFGDVRMSNGIGWSADGRRMYYIDTLSRSLDVFDYDLAAGIPRERRLVVLFSRDEGLPDGLCVDAEDRIWVALWGGRAVRCYSDMGKLLRTVRVPCVNVTACILGGRNNDCLYVTSAATDDPTPFAGRLFSCSVGVRGAVVARFDDRGWPPQLDSDSA